MKICNHCGIKMVDSLCYICGKSTEIVDSGERLPDPLVEEIVEMPTTSNVPAQKPEGLELNCATVVLWSIILTIMAAVIFTLVPMIVDTVADSLSKIFREVGL